MDKFGHETFGFTVGVQVGGIDRVDAKVPCGFHDVEGRFFVEDPRLDDGVRLRSHDAAKRSLEEKSGRTYTPFRRTKAHGSQLRLIRPDNTRLVRVDGYRIGALLRKTYDGHGDAETRLAELTVLNFRWCCHDGYGGGVDRDE